MVSGVARQPDAALGPVLTAEPDVVGLAFRLAGRIRQEFHSQMGDERWAVDAQLRPGCFGVLRAVGGAERPMSQRDVSQAIGIDASDVVDLVDRLERAGLLRRRRHDHDRRRNVLEVTTQGRRAIERFEAVSRRVDDVILEPLDAIDRAALRRLLLRVVDHREPPGRP